MSAKFLRAIAGRQSLCFLLTGLLGVFLLLTGMQGSAQGVTGTITGTISDPSGAPVSGAHVTIRAVETNAVRSVTTSAAGTYTVPQLPSGHYEIRVESAGFSVFEQKGMTLTIDQVAEINATLRVGSNQEVVEVIADTPVLQTEQSSNGLSLESEQIQNTPLNGRLSLLGLLILAPGVQNLATAQDSIPAFGETLSVGSTRRNSYGSMATTLDGTVNMQVSLQRDEAETPPLDALDQVKVITNGAPAEFGQQAQIIITSKSGTNQLHGEILEFNRSKGMNAKSHTFTTSTTARPPYERNEYGGDLAGPITIPHFYDGRDRSFFFAAYEGYNYTFSSMTSSIQPTEKMRDGDFSEFLSTGSCYSASKGEVHIVNRLTGTDYSSTNGNVINSGDINSVSSQLLKILYPHPTQSGCYTTNTYENIGYTQEARRFSLRLDHKLSDRDQFRGTLMHDFYGPYAYNWTDSLAGGYGSEGEHNVDTIVGWTHIFTPTLILDVPASYLHLLVVRMPHRSDVNFGSIIPGLNTTLNSGAPTITIKNSSGSNAYNQTLYAGSLASTSDNGGGHPGLEQDFQISPTLTKVFAKHIVKVGFTGFYSSFYDSSYNSKGAFTFSSSFSGDSFADFLLGIPTSTTNNLYNGQYPRHLMETQYSAFVQDDWKLLHNLTINYGIRWDKQHFFDDPYHRAALFVPEQSKVVSFGNSIPSSAIGVIKTALTNDSMLETSSAANMGSNPYDYLKEPSNNFAPRLGFSWKFLPKTVLRGAWGIYFNLLAPQYVSTWQGTALFTGSASYTNSKTAYNSNYFTMSNPFVTAGSTSTNVEIDAQSKSKTPYSETYNLQIERELPGNMTVRIGYAGQHNVKQNNNGQTSYINLNLASSATAMSYSTSTALQNSYKYQPLNSVLLQGYPWYHTSLNSLQAGLHKRYHGGSSVNAEFQWTRLLGVESFMDYTGAHPRDSYGPIGAITPLVLNLNYTYALPVGRGHMLLGHAGNLVDKIFSDWQYSGVGTFQSGQPFSVTFDYAGSTAYGNQRASRVAGVALYPKHKTVSEWFNPAAFTTPSYTKTTSGSVTTYNYNYGDSGYNMLCGPGWWNMDMNLQKNIRWGSRYNLLLRADSFNVFNHPNLGVPSSDISTTSSVGVISTNSTSTPVYESRSVEFGTKFTF